MQAKVAAPKLSSGVAAWSDLTIGLKTENGIATNDQGSPLGSWTAKRHSQHLPTHNN